MKLKYQSLEDYDRLLREAVKRNKPHQFYKSTVEKARLYRAIITGEDQDTYIFKFKDKETGTQKERRIRFHHPRTKSVANRLMCEFDQLDHNESTVSILHYPGSEDTDKINDLSEFLSCFDEDYSANEYVINHIKELNFYDPNAFVIIEHENGYSYAVTKYSHEIYDFDYDFGMLQYLITFEKRKSNDKEFTHYELRAPNISIILDFDHTEETALNYKVFSNTGTTVTPAIRAGYKRDPLTAYNTAIGILEPATEEFIGLMWTGSELDLQKKNHLFLQKFVYAQRCEYKRTIEAGTDYCNGGRLSISDEKCPTGCQNGYAVHRTASDIVVVKAPEGNEVVPLANRVHYVQVPSELITTYKDDLKDFEDRVFRAIFNAELVERSQLAPTATQQGINVASKYPVYSKVGKKISAAIMLTNQVTAEYNNIAKGLINIHKFPSNWQLEDLDTLVARRSQMIAAQVPRHQLKRLDSQINKIVYRNNPNDLARVAAYENHLPWQSLPSNVIQSLLMSLPNDHPDVVLYHYFDQIIKEIEVDLSNSTKEQLPKEFYQHSYQEQKQLIASKLDDFIARIPKTELPDRIGL